MNQNHPKDKGSNSWDGKSIEEFAREFIETKIPLSDSDKKFLAYIRQGVRVHVTKRNREDPGIQELIRLLSDLHQKGAIPHFEVVDI